jgi:hypothetical protein
VRRARDALGAAAQAAWPASASRFFARARAPAGAEFDAATGLRLFSLAELARHDGSDASLPLLLAMWGDVFDVGEKGAQFYGPGMSYAVFAGRDGTRALAVGSLEAEDVQSLDVSDFSALYMQMLVDQHKFYFDKYPRVGLLRPGEGAKSNYRGARPIPTPKPADATPEPATMNPAMNGGE